MRVETETGSVYRFEGGLVSRIPSEGELRRDGDWLEYSMEQPPTVGESMVFLLEPLGEGDVTLRRTSRVTVIGE